MATTNYDDLPPIPTDEPLILRAPEDASEQAFEAAQAVEESAAHAASRAAGGEYAKARAELAKLPSLIATAERLLKVAENGDLNVDDLVQARIPPAPKWFHAQTEVISPLRVFDPRLTTGTYQSGWTSGNPISPVRVVIDRLLAQGKLRKHGGDYRLRRV